MLRTNRRRIMIENVQPTVDAGLYPIKREIGDYVAITADVFRDGHQKIVVWVEYKAAHKKTWHKVFMTCTNPGLDIYEAGFAVKLLGFYEYRIAAYCDDFCSWLLDTQKKVDAGLDISSDILEGIALSKRYKLWLEPEDREFLKKQAALAEKAETNAEKWAYISDERLAKIMSDNPDPATRVESQI